ncbi:MAG TPA: asparagine synthase (glutamine-hydrolyzing), partial [Myxococcota bacterium]|nr:asparagine synthase (glutamine-hydrolyzing) [Myxococcota bacterium]
RLRTRSDSEIALHLYEELGAQCLHRLRGEFAFVLWDEGNQTLFAARDRFGIKPLFYAQVGDTLLLASEAKALFAAGVWARWDHESVFQDLHMIADGDRTMFHGVHQVPPGHYLLATRQRTQVVPYWDLSYPTADHPAPERSEDEHVERLRDALREAIRLRLRADVPVGVYLSGGLDSCSLLGVAASFHQGPLEAFTIAFEEGPFDEGPIAQEMAAHVGANFHRFRMPEGLLADHFADAIWQCETITFNANCVAKYLLSEKVRDFGFKVVLTGEGSDELMGGYPFFRQDMLMFNARGEDPETTAARMAELNAANRMYGGFGYQAGAALPTDSVRNVLGYVPTWIHNRAIAGRRAQPLLAADFFADFASRDPYQMFLNRIDLPEGAPRDPLNQSMWLWLKAVFPNKLLNFLGDRMEMAHSIEGRTPYLDHPLAELVCQMPVSMKVHGMTEKYVLREAARPYLTDTVYKRQKHPFMAPPELKGRLRELAEDTLRGPVLDSVPFFDRKAVIRFLDDEPNVPTEQRAFYYPTWITMLSICVLHERYGM